MEHSSRGFTLTEVMIVVVIAGMVTFGLVGFYLNSQATWLDASTQALAQRDATLITESIAEDAHAAAVFEIYASQHLLILKDYKDVEIVHYEWRADGDRMVHRVTGPNNDYAIGTSVVERFALSRDPDPRFANILHLDSLQVRSTMGRSIQMRSTFRLWN